MTQVQHLKTCPNGHSYIKSSNCPVCPLCEAERKPSSGWSAPLSAPARRALEKAGIYSLEHLASLTRKEVLALHGVGPSSIPKMESALAEKGLSFRA